MFAMAIYLSFALQGYVTIEVCWRRYSEYMTLKQSHPLEYVLRIAIVLGAGEQKIRILTIFFLYYFI